MTSFTERLKERKLVQWTLAYLAGAWLAIQVLDAIADVWGVSILLQRVIQSLLGLGFLFTLTIAWYHGEQGRQRVTGPELLIIAGLCAVGGVLIALLRDDTTRPANVAEADAARPRREKPSIVVLPLQNVSRDPADAYFADGMHEELIGRLSQISALSVIARTSALKYRNTEQSASEIAAELRVDYVLEGSATKENNRVRVHAQLIDGHTDEHIWADDYDRDLTVAHMIDIQQEVANQVARALSTRILPEESPRIGARPTENQEAYDAYWRGRYFWNQRTQEAFQRAVEYFNRALALDPDYATAYAGLADSYNTMGSFFILPSQEAFGQARTYALKALELDEDLAEAHASLGYARLNGSWDWASAEASYLRAMRLNDSYALAHQWYGQLLVYLGRSAQGIAELRQAADLDPMSLPTLAGLGYGLYLTRRYEESDHQFRAVQELDSTFFMAHLFNALPLLQMKRHDEAIAEVERAIALGGRQPPFVALLGTARGLAGQTEGAIELAEELVRVSKQQHVAPEQIATVYVHAGRTDLAFDLLERAFREQSYGLIYLRSDPLYDPLRSDPRFQDLLRRVGL